jgi:hypothetical protein
VKLKICTKCKEPKTLRNFNKDSKATDGLFYWCRACHNTHNRLYMRQVHEHSPLNNRILGSIGEHLTAVDLYRRGALELTWPDIDNGEDLHARFPSCGWRSVQVKYTKENLATGRIYRDRRKNTQRKVSSAHIWAFVGSTSSRVMYEPGTEDLPEELRDANL